MKFTVTSDRLGFPRGTVIDAADLVGGNIALLVAKGHLTSAPTSKTKWKPEPPVTVYDSADEPEEQE